MKKTTKKGFTLVELLVVIAILAILATVSVVGYTAFIERATVSNDENVAAQLNQFLTAMKADSTGEFYNKELVVKNGDTVDIDKTVANVRRAIKFAIIDSGLNSDGTLFPESARYGYHFYFDIEQGKIVVLPDKNALDTALAVKIVYGFISGAESESDLNPYTCITKLDGGKIRYAFLDTTGSDIADLINKAFNLKDTADYQEFIKSLNAAKDTVKGAQELLDAVENITIVDQSGTANTISGTDSKKYYVSDPALKTDAEGNVVKDENGKPKEEDIAITGEINFYDKTGENKTEGTTSNAYPSDITIPEHVNTVTGDFGSSNITFDGASNAADIAGKVEPEFTTSGTIKNESGTAEYEKKQEDESTVVIENKDDANDKKEVVAKWELTSFKILFFEDESKIRTKNDNEYYAKYGETPKLYIKQTQKNVNDPERERTLTSFSGITFEDNDYIIIDKEGTVTWNQAPSADNAKVTVKANSAKNISNEITLYVDFSKSATLKVGANEVVGNHATVVFNAKKDDKDTNTDLTNDGSFKLTASNVGYTYGVFSFDDKIEVSGDINTNGETFCNINPNATENKTLNLTVKVNVVYSTSIEVDLYDISSLPVQLTELGSQVGLSGNGCLGNDENTAIEVGDIFNLTKVPDGATLVAYDEAFRNDEYNDLINRGKLENTYDDTTKTGFSWNYNTTNTKLTFNGTGVITLAWVKDGVRISPDVTFNVVNAKNLKPNDDGSLITRDPGTDVETDEGNPNITYSDGATATVSGSCTVVGSNHHKITTYSLVLLGDYKMPSSGYIALAPKCTIYGNMYTLDCTNARTNTAYVIGLYGDAAIQDINIIGNDYSKDTDPWDDGGDSDTKSESASMVSTFGGGSITNAYIAYGRSPVRTRGAATIKDTVLFGGVYSNLDIQNGDYTVSLENVTTVNQGNVGTKKIGGSIVVADSGTQKVRINLIGSFKQYNFVANDETDKLMSLTGSDIGDMLLDWSDLFPGECGKTDISHGGGIYSKKAETFTFKYKTGETIDHDGVMFIFSTEDVYKSYMNPGIIFLNLDSGDGEVESSKIKIFCGNTNTSLEQKYPAGYGGMSVSAAGKSMTAVSTLNTFTVNNTELNDNKNLLEAYRNEAKAYMPGQCSANRSTWTFTYTAPATTTTTAE